MEEAEEEFFIFLVAPDALQRLKIVSFEYSVWATYRSVPLKEGTCENGPCT